MVGVIRAYGTGLQGQVSPHLEQSLKQLLSQQPAPALRVKTVAAAEPPRPRVAPP
jgi:hypothetical protein